jgi:hypothetical protein
MCEDGRFKRFGSRKYFGEIDDKKIGVVLATKNVGYDTCALNNTEFEGLLRVKRDGRLDEAYVVAVRVNGAAVPRYWDQIDAEQLAAKLANEVPRSGRFGDFFVLPPGIGFPAQNDDSEPF